MASINTNNDIKDVTFEVDEFAKNKIISGASAEAQQLFFLMCAKPGDYEDDPDRGIDISKYKYGLVENDAIELKTSIETQVAKYCQFQLSNVYLTYMDETLVIALETPSSDDIVLFKTTDDTSVVMQLIKS